MVPATLPQVGRSPATLLPPRRQRPVALRAVAARELTFGVWLLTIESSSRPGTAHEVKVSHGQAGPCDCTAAGFKLDCHHRRDAADIAKALDVYAAAKATIQAAYEQWMPENRECVEKNKGEMEFSLWIIQKMGYRLERLAVAA